MAKVVVVACEHRTGSGCLAQILHTLGVSMLDTPEPTRSGDDRWEDAEFVWLHQAVLGEVPRGGRENYAPAWWYPKPVWTVETLQDYEDLAARRSARAVWGYKDPRTLFMMDLELGILSGMGHDVRVIGLTRHRSEIAASLHQRDGAASGLSAENYYGIATVYREQSQLMQLRYRKAFPWLQTDYKQLVQDPHAVVRCLSRFLDLSCTGGELEGAARIVRTA